jgi:hypothetical protein
VSTESQRPPEAEPHALDNGGLLASPPEVNALTLGSLPTGTRIVLRCRKDWRAATVASFDAATSRVVLSVGSPSGHTYRLRRPADSPLTLDGPIPVLGEGHWRAGLARYDVRW